VQAGHLTVGAMHTMGPVDLSLLLADFHARHPAVELTVREQSSEDLAEMLRVNELDLAFLSVTERVESHGLGLHQLVTEPLVALLPTDHRLGTRRRVRLAELADRRFIGFREGARLRELLVSAAREAGFEPRIALEPNDSRRIRSLVARGLGVAILPRSGADEAAAAFLDLAPRRRGGRGRVQAGLARSRAGRAGGWDCSGADRCGVQSRGGRRVVDLVLAAVEAASDGQRREPVGGRAEQAARGRRGGAVAAVLARGPQAAVQRQPGGGGRLDQDLEVREVKAAREREPRGREHERPAAAVLGGVVGHAHRGRHGRGPALRPLERQSQGARALLGPLDHGRECGRVRR